MSAILLLIVSLAGAATTNVPGVKVRNEGSNIGQSMTLDCVGTGINCSYSGGVATLNVGSGGTVGVSSSCAVGQYWDGFNATDGVVNGGTCQTLPSGSEGNTYTSSKTFTSEVKVSSSLYVTGHIRISASNGLRTDLSPSTFSICGPLFFISSNSVVGSSTTFGTAVTSLSTYTLLANTIGVGDTLSVTCGFYQTTAPGTPVMGVYVDDVARGTNASVVANAFILHETQFVVVGSSRAINPSIAQSQTTAATALVSVTAGFNLTGVGFDTATNRRINCKASRATGGNINFAYMRVSKRCQ